MHSAKAKYIDLGMVDIYVSSYDRTSNLALVSRVQQRLNAVRPLGLNLVSAAAEVVSLNLSVRLYTNGTQSSDQLISDAKEFLEAAVKELGVGESLPLVVGGRLCSALSGVRGWNFFPLPAARPRRTTRSTPPVLSPSPCPNSKEEGP